MRKSGGFTLIELMIAVSVMVMITTAGLASYRNYNLKQKQTATIARMRQVFQEAKSNALSGKKDCAVCGGADGKCDGVNDIALAGWSVNLYDGTHYVLQGECGAGEFMKRDEVLPIPPVRSGPCNGNKTLFSPDGTVNLSGVQRCQVYFGAVCDAADKNTCVIVLPGGSIN